MEQAKTTEGLFRDFFLLFQQQKATKNTLQIIFAIENVKKITRIWVAASLTFERHCFHVFVIAKWLQLNLLLSIVMLALSSLLGI